MERHIIQICAVPETAQGYEAVYALCNDGSLWTYQTFRDQPLGWKQIEPIPQEGFDRAEASIYRAGR